MNSSGRKWREFPKHVTTCTGLEQPLRMDSDWRGVIGEDFWFAVNAFGLPLCDWLIFEPPVAKQACKTRYDMWGRCPAGIQGRCVPSYTVGVSTSRWRRYPCSRHFEILPLPSNIRLWMFLRWNELTNRHWSPTMSGMPRTAECECGIERTGIRGTALFRYWWRFKQIGKYHDDVSPDY